MHSSQKYARGPQSLHHTQDCLLLQKVHTLPGGKPIDAILVVSILPRTAAQASARRCLRLVYCPSLAEKQAYYSQFQFAS